MQNRPLVSIEALNDLTAQMYDLGVEIARIEARIEDLREVLRSLVEVAGN